jgi:hypothetical protein
MCGNLRETLTGKIADILRGRRAARGSRLAAR